MDESSPFQVPALRRENQPDEHDEARRAYAHELWHGQDGLRRAYERQVEENVQMLAGRQWLAWVDVLGKFVDVEAFLSEDEKRWRQRPVVNRLLFWFMLLHARLTESSPIITFSPGPDRIDSLLAEVMDTVYKVLWHEVGMTDVIDRVMAWLLPGGQAFLKTRVDPWGGPIREWWGPMVVSSPGAGGLSLEQVLTDPATGEPMRVPFDQDGNPLVEFGEDGTPTFTGSAHREYEGGLRVDVLGPLECRGEWGNRPWHQKRWHMHRSYLSPEEVYDTWGLALEPEVTGLDTGQGGELMRMLFGTGYYGSADPERTGGVSGDMRSRQGYVRVDELWHAPSAIAGMEQTDDSPGGRLLIVTKNTVIRDGPRPARYRYTSPIRMLEFVRLPGRPMGTTPQESLNPLQRMYNRGYGQFLEHRNLCTNPVTVVDTGSGIQEGDLVSQPGATLYLHRRAGVVPIEFVSPPPLGNDAYKVQDLIGREIQELGTAAVEGRLPAADASGELVRELRYNWDRLVGPTSRRAAPELARMVEDWMATIEVLWDQEKILTYAGDDQIARTVAVSPEMWKGKANVIPDLESMLPESRGERIARVRQMYVEDQAFGPVGDPRAVRQYLELARFPNLSRASRPGGVHRVTAEQENGKLVLGELAEGLPIFRWYDHMVHLETHFEFMSSPEYLKLDPNVMNEFVLHTTAHEGALIAAQMQATAMQATVQADAAAKAGAVSQIAAASGATGDGQPASAAAAA